ncbi:uncharacterized protein LOC142504573 [Primulina tabacum]|uniref:uncharacterized protein LOC142504573 n=1 Tax=Primulina tabacum TaxID=48773 RepID=UPI003F59BA92
MAASKQHWWLTSKRVVDTYVKEAKMLIATQDHREIVSALGLLDAALAVSPRAEAVLELKARCLLHLRRFKEVGDMLQDYIPSLKMLVSDDASTSSSSDNSSSQAREQVKLLPSSGREEAAPFKCFSVSDLKRKVMAGLCKNAEKEAEWRYSVLGQACCHLGLMEDAIVLLQSGKRIATAAFRRESISLSEDSFSSYKFPLSSNNFTECQQETPPKTESETISQLLCHTKLLVRRKAAAIASLNAGLYSEAIRHFSKIVDGRRRAPQGFLSECYVHRASAYQSAGRLAEAIADCNRAIALDTCCIDALTIRAAVYETITCLPDSLHDLEHLKLLYNSILRDRKLMSPVWKRQNVQYREIPGKLCSLAYKMQQLKQRVADGETRNVDYYSLIGLKSGCSRSELERGHLLLTLKHRPDKSLSFVDRCAFADEKNMDSVRERAKTSALMLYRLIQKAYTSVMASILEEAAAEKQRKKVVAVLQAVAIQVQQAQEQPSAAKIEPITDALSNGHNGSSITIEKKSTNITPPQSVFQGVFCRDIGVVGNLISQAGFNRPISVKYEALSC